jgi:hypothetical protein
MNRCKTRTRPLLEWLLRRTSPRAVTLEYWKDSAQARDQILRLNELIAQVNKEKLLRSARSLME